MTLQYEINERTRLFYMMNELIKVFLPEPSLIERAGVDYIKSKLWTSDDAKISQGITIARKWLK